MQRFEFALPVPPAIRQLTEFIDFSRIHIDGILRLFVRVCRSGRVIHSCVVSWLIEVLPGPLLCISDNFIAVQSL